MKQIKKRHEYGKGSRKEKGSLRLTNDGENKESKDNLRVINGGV